MHSHRSGLPSHQGTERVRRGSAAVAVAKANLHLRTAQWGVGCEVGVRNEKNTEPDSHLALRLRSQLSCGHAV